MRHLLLLCNRPVKSTNAETITEHIEALVQLLGWKVWELSMIGDIPSTIDLNRFDAVGIHYTILLNDPNYRYLSKYSINVLSHFQGLKCVWVQDEYRNANLG